MWKITDLQPSQSYFLRLCENEKGIRTFLLLPHGQESSDRTVLETEPVPFDLLRKRDLESIAESIRLRSGGRFTVDAHGIWFTEEEASVFRQSHGDLSKVPWVNGRIPRLAER